MTALMLATVGGHTEIVLLLLEHRAEINVVNKVCCVLGHTSLLSHQKFVHLMKTSKEIVESLNPLPTNDAYMRHELP